MEYKIKHSFYSPDQQFSGLAGRIIDKKLYENAIKWGYKDRVEIVGFVPATFRTDEELDAEIAELLAEKERRAKSQSKEKSKVLDVETSEIKIPGINTNKQYSYNQSKGKNFKRN